MDITLVVGVACAAVGAGLAAYGVFRLRKARKTLERAELLADASKKVVESAVAVVEAVTGAEVAGVSVTPVESEIAQALKALRDADVPTPGCGCDACDERRLRQASADVKRGE